MSQDHTVSYNIHNKVQDPGNNRFLNRAWELFKQEKINLPLGALNQFFYDLSVRNWMNDLNQPINYPDNNQLAKFIKQYLETIDVPVRLTQVYEYCAKLAGEKNWNVASSKNINFFEAFFPGILSISTGIPQLDKDLGGGFRRGRVVGVKSRSNLGKTRMVKSLACSALRDKFSTGRNKNLKVLHIDLEESADRSLIGYACNILDLTQKELEQIDGLSEKLATYETSLMAKSPRDKYHYSFASFEKDCEDFYSKFPFDVIVVDYVQLFSDYGDDFPRKSLSEHALLKIAQKYNCVILTPIQKLSGTALNYNPVAYNYLLSLEDITDEERVNRQMRILLEESDYVRNVFYTLDGVDFAKSKLIKT